MSDVACSHCGVLVAARIRKEHWSDLDHPTGYGHRGLCCECFDLSCGKPIELVNERRTSQGLPPVEPFPTAAT